MQKSSQPHNPLKSIAPSEEKTISRMVNNTPKNERDLSLSDHILQGLMGMGG